MNKYEQLAAELKPRLENKGIGIEYAETIADRNRIDFSVWGGFMSNGAEATARHIGGLCILYGLDVGVGIHDSPEVVTFIEIDERNTPEQVERVLKSVLDIVLGDENAQSDLDRFMLGLNN
ncbi:hypothetical protein [Vibrio sp. WXL210]|uniref:hypothetical protein n=1 Tax=Vibrio sp. WXL210 TaxID=3450709 RepID=UPI003EC56D37